MFSTVLQEIKGYFGRSFLLSVFLPVLIFISINFALFFECRQGFGKAVSAWDAMLPTQQVLILLSSIVVAGALSYLVSNFQYVITRLFEGYWPEQGTIGWLRRKRILYYQRRHGALYKQVKPVLMRTIDPTRPPIRLIPSEEAIVTQFVMQYPLEKEHIMPTQVGNILRAGEMYAFSRYKITAFVVWPRLRQVLKSEALVPLEEKRMALDFSLLMTLLVAVLTLVWVTVLALIGNRWDLFLGVLSGWPLTALCYANAVQSAIAYSEQLKATFDLHRQDLLTSINLKQPENTQEEAYLWLDLSHFYLFNRTVATPATDAKPTPDGWDRVANTLADFLVRVTPPAHQSQATQPTGAPSPSVDPSSAPPTTPATAAQAVPQAPPPSTKPEPHIPPLSPVTPTP